MLLNRIDMDNFEQRVAAIEAALDKMMATWSVKRVYGLYAYVHAVRFMTLRRGHW